MISGLYCANLAMSIKSCVINIVTNNLINKNYLFLRQFQYYNLFSLPLPHFDQCAT